MNTEHYQEEQIEMNGIPLKVITYKIGSDFHCHVHNLDPGAVIARSSATSSEKAREEAVGKATERLVKS
jgi:hypothetical protein